MGPNQQAILRDAARIGDRFGVSVRTAVRRRVDAEEAILRQLKIGEHNLIVIGVNSRAGDYPLLRRRAKGGVEATPSFHLVGRELTEAAPSVASASD